MIDPQTFNSQANFHGSKGLVCLNEKIVVIRRDAQTNNFPLHTDLPGGRREGSESPFETFKREVEEELGILILEDSIVYSKRYASVLYEGAFAYFFVAQPTHLTCDDIVFGDEGLEYFMTTPEEFVLFADGVPGQQARVNDYLSFLASFDT